MVSYMLYSIGIYIIPDVRRNLWNATAQHTGYFSVLLCCAALINSFFFSYFVNSLVFFLRNFSVFFFWWEYLRDCLVRNLEVKGVRFFGFFVFFFCIVFRDEVILIRIIRGFG